MRRAAIGVALGYAIGNFPTADLAARLAAPGGPDLRTVGSRNPGAVNAANQLGPGWGAAVLTVDVTKGVVAAALGRALGGPNVGNLAASAAVAGHTHPIGREGGKGVATSVGQVIGTFPRYLPLDAGVAMATAALPRWTQRTWAATALASCVWVGASSVAWARRLPTGIDDRAPITLPLSAAASSLLIAVRFLRTPLRDGAPIDSPDDRERP